MSIAKRQWAVAKRAIPRNELVSYRAEKAKFTELSKKLREENSDLREEIEEMKAMLEMLKGQISGRQSLVSDPVASPFLGPALSLGP